MGFVKGQATVIWNRHLIGKPLCPPLHICWPAQPPKNIGAQQAKTNREQLHEEPWIADNAPWIADKAVLFLNSVCANLNHRKALFHKHSAFNTFKYVQQCCVGFCAVGSILCGWLYLKVQKMFIHYYLLLEGCSVTFVVFPWGLLVQMKYEVTNLWTTGLCFHFLTRDAHKWLCIQNIKYFNITSDVWFIEMGSETGPGTKLWVYLHPYCFCFRYRRSERHAQPFRMSSSAPRCTSTKTFSITFIFFSKKNMNSINYCVK